MSYDLYCYRSRLGKPDEAEADSVIITDNDKWVKKEKDPAMKLAIVRALTAYNPRLEAIVNDPQTGQVFDPAEIEFDGLDKYLSV